MWYALNGEPMTAARWDDPGNATLLTYIDGDCVDDESFLLCFHGSAHDITVTLPHADAVKAYRLMWDSAWERPDAAGERLVPGQERVTSGPSMQIFRAIR